MEEKRRKFGIEMFPGLHKRLKGIALDRDVSLWRVTDEALRRYISTLDNSTALTSTACEPKLQGITIEPQEAEAVEMLLKILRHGKPSHREAVMWNLRGWAESALEVQGGDKPTVATISEALGLAIKAAEELSEAEAISGKQLEGLRQLQKEIADVPESSRKSGTTGGKGGSGSKRGPGGRSKG